MSMMWTSYRRVSVHYVTNHINLMECNNIDDIILDIDI